MRILRWLPGILLLVSLIGLQPAYAQCGTEEVCTDLWTTALDSAQNCAPGADEVCFGHSPLAVEVRASAADLPFAAAGDVLPAQAITTLQADSPGPDCETWGIALARLRADLPDEQALTLVAAGSLTLTPGEPVPPFFGISVGGPVNLRAMPSTRANIVGQITAGQPAVVDGRLVDSSWLRVQWQGSYAWVFAEIVSPMGDVAVLDVVDPAEPLTIYGPLQAFYLTTAPPTVCPQIPGLLVQTPPGTRATLLINEVEVQMEGTAWITAANDEALSVCAVAGQARLNADPGAGLALAGTCRAIPLDGDLAPVRPPNAPTAFTLEAAVLPLALLPDPVATAPPLAADDLARLAITPQSGPWIAAFDPAVLDCAGDFGGPVDMSALDGAYTLSSSADGATLTLTGPDEQISLFTRSSAATYTGEMALGGAEAATVILTLDDAARLTGQADVAFANACTAAVTFTLAHDG
jgi:hypothetical protein